MTAQRTEHTPSQTAAVVMAVVAVVNLVVGAIVVLVGWDAFVDPGTEAAAIALMAVIAALGLVAAFAARAGRPGRAAVLGGLMLLMVVFLSARASTLMLPAAVVTLVAGLLAARRHGDRHPGGVA